MCAWAFGRLAGLRDPGPGCLAAATLPFLFEPSFSIYGGNILSTLAGEFSFSLSLSVALLFLGVVGRRAADRPAPGPGRRALRRHPALPPAPGAVRRGRAVVWLLLDADLVRGLRRGRRGRGGPPAVVRDVWSGRWWPAPSAWASPPGGWCPFAAEQAYTTNMGYTKVLGFPHLLFPGSARWVLAADLVGLVAMVVRRNRVALFIVVMGGSRPPPSASTRPTSCTTPGSSPSGSSASTCWPATPWPRWWPGWPGGAAGAGSSCGWRSSASA